MSIKIGSLVKAREAYTNIVVEGLFRGYELTDKEDSKSIVGYVFGERNGKKELFRVSVDSIEVIESDDDRIRKKILELVGISGNGNDWEEINAWLEKQKEQKPAEWSDRDWNMRNNVLVRLESLLQYETQPLAKGYLENEIKWLRSISPQQKQECGEEDMAIIDDAIYFLREYRKSLAKNEGDFQNAVTCEEWLKKLAPKRMDKQDKEMLNVVLKVINDAEDRYFFNVCDYSATDVKAWLMKKLCPGE